jgi:hypothetical protein
MLVSTCRVDLQSDLRRGYVLHVTNLEDRALEYLVSFVVTVQVGFISNGPDASEVERFARITGDSFLIEQPFRRMAAGEGRAFEPGRTYNAAVRFFVGAKKTASIGIEPPQPLGGVLGGLLNAFGGRQSYSFSRLQGYVTLRLPPARSLERKFFRQAQADGPVRVLINPETRTIYYTGGGRSEIYDDPPPTANPFGVFTGGPATIDPPPVQSGFSYLPSRAIERTEPLHIASGKAENELEPEGSGLLTVENVHYAVEALKGERAEAIEYRGAGLVADQDRAGALIELLCEVGEDAVLTRTINQILQEQNAAVRIRTGDD